MTPRNTACDWIVVNQRLLWLSCSDLKPKAWLSSFARLVRRADVSSAEWLCIAFGRLGRKAATKHLATVFSLPSGMVSRSISCFIVSCINATSRNLNSDNNINVPDRQECRALASELMGQFDAPCSRIHRQVIGNQARCRRRLARIGTEQVEHLE